MALDGPTLDGYMFMVGEGRHAVRQDKNKKKSIGPVKGETLDDRFYGDGAFQISSFKWECKLDNLGSSRADAKTVVGAFTVVKEIDIATPTLFLANVTASVFKGAHVYFRKASGSKMQTYFHLIFSDVLIEKWDISLQGKETTENLTVNFNWVEVNYYPQVTDGTRKKGDPANMKQYCTANPESEDVPRIFRKNRGGELQEGDLAFLQ